MSDLSHVYGCERRGCNEVGEPVQVWRPGFGFELAYLCFTHRVPQCENPRAEGGQVDE